MKRSSASTMARALGPGSGPSRRGANSLCAQAVVEGERPLAVMDGILFEQVEALWWTLWIELAGAARGPEKEVREARGGRLVAREEARSGAAGKVADIPPRRAKPQGSGGEPMAGQGRDVGG